MTLLRLSQAAEYVGFSNTTLLKLTKEGKIKVHWFNKERRYKTEELDEYLDKI